MRKERPAAKIKLFYGKQCVGKGQRKGNAKGKGIVKKGEENKRRVLRMSNAFFAQGCILNLGVAKSGSSVIHATSGHTRNVQGHRAETVIIPVNYAWNR